MITNYSELVAQVGEHLARSSLVAQAPLFVQLAESKLRRSPETTGVRRLVDEEFVIDSAEISLPEEFGEIESVYFDGTGSIRGELLIYPTPGLLSQHMCSGVPGIPAYGAVVGNVLRVAPAPADAYTARIAYWQKPARLSDQTPSNWLLEADPDVYLYGALCEAEPYLKNDERFPLWKSLFNEAVAGVRDQMQKRQLGRMSLPSRTFG